ncbi:MAG TPA: transcription termination factor NusA [Anaerolineae bacterium]|nr:transcription termination factor NusA [Anaerolineae bacterium]
MKSQFILAFNEICESRGLPKEEVIEALKTALVSAYRRNTNVSNTQEVTVEIDARTGEPTIFAEKEVVDSIIDNRTEVMLDVAQRSGYPKAELGDMVMVDSTPSDFGRIAAQTAKQVLLQRVREAEREQLFEDFSAREGEIINGTVQSISGQHITIGLGRTEAILPKSQQVSTERYRAHDKIRVYVLEVRRTNRGPQIFVSRNHRNLLRRLLELEVPEIYNGQVDIKSIAREAGARSKVAVMALQPGVDPVGACVGMRGVRIQSIVRELNDEKIDVIEWDIDQKTFIAKALSPARVSQVFLEDHPDNGKTAVVVVPDDQLSLAIGREGQNARLAAKLTGWRIDIKSLTESASDSLNNLDHPVADQAIVGNEKLIEQVRIILEKKAANRPITAEDYNMLNRLVGGVEGNIIAARAKEYEIVRRNRALARKQVPEYLLEVAIDELLLSDEVYDVLMDHEISTIGDVVYHLALDESHLLDLPNLDEAGLAELKQCWATFEEELKAKMAAEAEAEAAPAKETTDVTPPEEPVAVAEVVDEEVADALMSALAETEAEDDEDETEELSVAEEESEPVAEAIAETTAPPTLIQEDDEEYEDEDEDEGEYEDDEDDEDDDLYADYEPDEYEDDEYEDEDEDEEGEDEIEGLTPLVPINEEPRKQKQKKKPKITLARPINERKPDQEPTTGGRRRKGKQLIYDEGSGRVVVKRKRKGSRSRPTWEDDEFDY